MALKIKELARTIVSELVKAAYPEPDEADKVIGKILDVKDLDLVNLFERSMRQIDVSFVTYIVRSEKKNG
jgi:hypothetical protein